MALLPTRFDSPTLLFVSPAAARPLHPIATTPATRRRNQRVAQPADSLISLLHEMKPALAELDLLFDEIALERYAWINSVLSAGRFSATPLMTSPRSARMTPVRRDAPRMTKSQA